MLAIALVVFGPKRVPEIGKNLGTAIRGFREALKSDETASETPTAARPADPGASAAGNGPKAQ